MNRLGKEKSPYLRQHADNPVDWYPWCPEALERAVNEDKPILLSIGYSACHWCHVMAHESFENREIAALMNEKFINIKVDREERPDIDHIYMEAVQSLGGRGGWPITAVLMPDGRPFFGGTYFPPVPRMGMPSFPQVLNRVHDAYISRREELLETASKVKDILSADPGSDTSLPMDEAAMSSVFKEIVRNFDWKNGGFGRAPKFPSPMTLEFLMRYGFRAGEEERNISRKMLSFTLRVMAGGGIYDQVGGGFHRYSVDEKWRVPHFEKMLSDNAQLSRVYLNGWKITGDPLQKFISEDINNYIIREMQSPEGGFYSASDADSEGVEGKFFLWSRDDFQEIAGDDYDLLAEYWGVDRDPDFEGSHILNIAVNGEELASKHGLSPEEFYSRVKAVREILYMKRGERTRPHIDRKILTSWNGMMTAALAQGARVLERDDFLHAASRAGRFLIEKMSRPGGGLYRSFIDGTASVKGYLEDYAHLIDAMIELYQSTGDLLWIEKGREYAEFCIKNFRDESGLFFDNGKDHEELFVRPRNLQDNALPSGNAKISREFQRLALYTGEDSYSRFAEDIIRSISGFMVRYPLGFSEALNSSLMMLQGLTKVVISGRRDNPLTLDMLSRVNRNYSPDILTAYRFDESGECPGPLALIPFQNEGAAAYLCKDQTCSEPLTSADELERALNL